jgi:hypothetical protein
MSEAQIQRLKKLKSIFRKLPAKKREALGISFLKVKLRVHATIDLNNIKEFLGDFHISFVPENLDNMINFLHSEENTLPEFIAMEDSLNHIEVNISTTTDKKGLPTYDPDNVETLKDGVKPFKN